MNDLNLAPVLVGADQNCYNVARAFHEEYGIKSYALGRYPIGITQNTKIVEFFTVPNINSEDFFVCALRDFADAHSDEILIALGCTDEYAAMLIRHKAELEDKYILPYIDADLMDTLVNKADFYTACEKYGIPYPKTKIICEKTDAAALCADALGFEYPIIIKPSSSIDYWHNAFDGMKKVYTAESPADAEKIISRIYQSGYGNKIILQDLIPGTDSGMRVLTCYSDRNKKVKMMCLGHVLLEEHTPKGLGNHAAIITEYNPELTAKFRAMLDDLGYTGFSNFDIKFDPRDGSLRAFEINLRQGRSNYYVTSSGANIAKLLVEDRILKSDLNFLEVNEAHFWHYVPLGVVYKYADKKYLPQVKKLVAEKKESSSMWYSYDVRFNPARLFYLIIHGRRFYAKYKQYCPRQNFEG